MRMAKSSKPKIKVGVVGCGVVATAYYLPYLMDHSDLVAVCDLNPHRTQQVARLFGAREQYQDYGEMLARADIEAVLILTGPGTHARFAIQAAQAGKHILLQKPMATSMADAQDIVQAVRQAGVVALIEPSSNSPLEPGYAVLRELVRSGAIGQPYWFISAATGPDCYGPSLGSNPYGVGAFFAPDSGGVLFDYAYGPSQIAAVLGACQSVSGAAKISIPKQAVVPDKEYDKYLSEATDPSHSNYWDVVINLPRTQEVTMGAADNVFSMYEMASGAIGVHHAGRTMHPRLPGTGGAGLEVFGTEGNIIFGGGYFASVISANPDRLPTVEDDGWFHIPITGDTSKAKWPQPVPGGFNYYHASAQHLIDCIITGREPVINVEWGLHITEMMVGAMQSAESGLRYQMTTTLDY